MVKKDLLMNRIRRSLITTLAATSLLLCTTLALPSGADAASTTKQILLNDHWTGKDNIEYGWGTGSDIYLVGDWDGNGQDSLAIRRQNVYHIRNKLSGGVAERTVSYGRPILFWLVTGMEMARTRSRCAAETSTSSIMR